MLKLLQIDLNGLQTTCPDWLIEVDDFFLAYIDIKIKDKSLYRLYQFFQKSHECDFRRITIIYLTNLYFYRLKSRELYVLIDLLLLQVQSYKTCIHIVLKLKRLNQVNP